MTSAFDSAKHEFGHYLVSLVMKRTVIRICINKTQTYKSHVAYWRSDINNIDDVADTFAVCFAGCYSERSDITTIPAEIRGAFFDNAEVFNADTVVCLNDFSIFLEQQSIKELKTNHIKDTITQGGAEMETFEVSISSDNFDKVKEQLDYCIDEGIKRMIKIIDSNKEKIDRFATKVIKMAPKKLTLKPQQIDILSR